MTELGDLRTGQAKALLIGDLVPSSSESIKVGVDPASCRPSSSNDPLHLGPLDCAVGLWQPERSSSMKYHDLGASAAVRLASHEEGLHLEFLDRQAGYPLDLDESAV